MVFVPPVKLEGKIKVVTPPPPTIRLSNELVILIAFDAYEGSISGFGLSVASNGILVEFTCRAIDGKCL